MSIDIAGDPTRLDTLFGDTNIPAPIIVPTMRHTPELRVILTALR